MKTKSIKIVSLLLTMIVLVATFCLFTTMANAAEQSATITFDNLSKMTSSTNTQQVWQENGITVTYEKGSYNQNLAEYANPVRFYSGTKLTIEYPGRTITKIEFVCGSTTYANTLKGSIGTSATASGSTVTVTLNATDGIFTIAKLTGQVRVKSMTVYGEVSENPDCAHENTTKTPNEDGKTHNIVCDDCGNLIVEEHNNSEPQDAGNGTHTSTCSVCQFVTVENHINTGTDNGDGTHTLQCSVCQATSQGKHTSDTSCTDCPWIDTSKIVELTLTFDDDSKRTAFSTSEQVWTENGITLTNTKANGSSNVVNNFNPIRLYKGSIVTIDCLGMTKIEFVCDTAEYTTNLKNSISGNSVTVEGTTVTVTLAQPSDSYTITLTGGQTRFRSITVVAVAAECEHENKTYVSLNNHNHKVTCADCGEEIAEEAHTIVGLACDKCDFVLPFEFGGWSLTLYDNLSLNYTVNAAFFANGYSNPSATFVIGERTIVVTEYTEKDGKYVFTLSDIAPYQMGVTIQATLSATKDGETVTDTTERTIKAYCMQLLADETQEAAVKTLVVDLLNYGAASQTYVGATDALVNADLTDAQKALGTQGEPALTTVANSAYVKVDNAKVTWVGAQLLLVDTVEMNFVFRAESTEGLVVKVVTASGKTYTITEFGAYSEGAYMASFSALNAAQMSEVVDVTVYEGDTAVSNTYRYSIESYACAKQGDADANLASLVKAMMVYGNSAKAYVEALKGANA